MTASQHYTSLVKGRSLFKTELGEVTRVNADELPILNGLSIKRLVLEPGSIRAPHWHANASELAYCVSGEVLVSVLGNGSAFSCFEVASGQMFHIESGALHAIENIGTLKAELIIAFRHERPEDFSLHAAFGAMTDPVLGNLRHGSVGFRRHRARYGLALHHQARGHGAAAVVGPAGQFAQIRCRGAVGASQF
jgi:oxalate decarboxylase